MTLRQTIAARARRIVALVATLTLLGTASAAAYWIAHASVDTKASAASIGLEQALLPAGGSTPLNGTYTSSTSILAGTVTVTNTGSRSATPALSVSKVQVDGGTLPATALEVTVTQVNDAAQCAPQASLTGTRTVAPGGRLDLSTRLEPSATALLCVRTTLTPGQLPALAGKQIDLALYSSLQYADGEQWTIQSPDPLAVSQHVEDDPYAAVATMTPGGQQEGWYLSMGFPKNVGHEGETNYRASLAWEDAPSDRVAYGVPPTGYDITQRLCLLV